METISYGLRVKKNGEILGYDVRYTGITQEEYSRANELSYYLTVNEHMWLVHSKEQAEDVKFQPRDMYESSYNCPEHSYKPEELEVVEIIQTLSIRSIEEENIVKIKLNSEYQDNHYIVYSLGNKFGGNIILSQLLKDTVLTVRDEGKFYKILSVPQKHNSLLVHKYLKKEDFIVIE